MVEMTEIARAKVNLTLRVHGRRTDGFHELESIVVFAQFGDRVGLTMSPKPLARRASVLKVDGPFAADIVGENLIAKSVRLVEDALGEPIGCDIVLEKNMPVASGIGGGSADAAAALRAMRAGLADRATSIDWLGIAAKLGADVPVCFAGHASIMTGIGEGLLPITLPALDIVLVNPMLPVPADKTRQVFRALAAPPLLARPARLSTQTFDRVKLKGLIHAVGNDLEASATKVIPGLREAKAVVAATQGCEIALLSGAGPTIVGIYPSPAAARAAAGQLQLLRPHWWVQPSVTSVA